jgi:hypothetical protein
MESTVVTARMVYVSLRPASVYAWTLAGMVISVAVPICVLWRRYQMASPVPRPSRLQFRLQFGRVQVRSGTVHCRATEAIRTPADRHEHRQVELKPRCSEAVIA